jgi:hypothetical protein
VKRKSKFNNVHVMVDSVRFDSKKEAKRYGELKLLERTGNIWNLVLQPSFPCRVNGHLICTYRADFAYDEKQQDRIVRVVEDVKSPITRRLREYIHKKKLVFALYDITIRET